MKSVEDYVVYTLDEKFLYVNLIHYLYAYAEVGICCVDENDAALQDTSML